MRVPRAALLVVASLASAPLAGADDDEPNLRVQAARVARLIEQLGSVKCQEREAASKALDTFDETALGALRQVATESPDAEVRRSARLLVERSVRRQVQQMRTGKLPGWSKQRKLHAVVQPGMTVETVDQLLGEQGQFRASEHCVVYYIYPACGAFIGFGWTDQKAREVDVLRYLAPMVANRPPAGQAVRMK